MSGGTIGAICGFSNGVAALTLGTAIKALAEHRQVIVIRFFKGSQEADGWSIMKRLEPEMKIFCFEKSERCFHELTAEEKSEAHLNVLNGLNFAKKVVSTGECDLLILDGLLELLGHQIVTAEDFRQLFACRHNAELLLTGERLPEELLDGLSFIERVLQVNVDN